MSVCAWYPQRPEESVKPPGARLQVVMRYLAWMLGMELRSSIPLTAGPSLQSTLHSSFFSTFKEITKTRHPTLKLLLRVEEMRKWPSCLYQPFPRDFHFLFVTPLRSSTMGPSGHLCKGLPLEGGSTKGGGRETCQLHLSWPSTHPHPSPSSWPFSCPHSQPLTVFLGRLFFSKDSRHWHVRWSYQIPC